MTPNSSYTGMKQAAQSRLITINSAGNAIMKVDNKTKLNFGNNRNSIRINTKDHYTVGSLWVTDMLHVPYGCSVWPAFWSSAADWPSGGEVRRPLPPAAPR